MVHYMDPPTITPVWMHLIPLSLPRKRRAATSEKVQPPKKTARMTCWEAGGLGSSAAARRTYLNPCLQISWKMPMEASD